MVSPTYDDKCDSCTGIVLLTTSVLMYSLFETTVNKSNKRSNLLKYLGVDMFVTQDKNTSSQPISV